MEAVCENCSHWEEQIPMVADKDKFGHCNQLSQPQKQMHEDYILPVLNNGKVMSDQEKGLEYITMASFGCNQFDSE
jgi:hypothetical protein